jgi:hypothetical protein
MGTFKIGKEPVPGTALIGGGEGDRTVLFQLGWSARTKGTAEDGQGPKLPGLDSSIISGVKFTTLLAPAWKWPARLPLTVVRLGDLHLLVTPVEMTTAMAYRLRKVFLGDSKIDAVMIGLANEYVSYATTPEEYMPQDYSAASTLWGPNEGPYIACNLAQLTAPETKTAPDKRLGGRFYYPCDAPRVPFGPKFLGDTRLLPTEGIEMVLRDADGRPAPSLPWFQWPERSEGSCPEDVEVSDFKAAALRRLWIEEWQGTWVPRHTNCTVENDPGPDDDTGFNLLTVLMAGSEARDRKYAGVWLRPLRAPINGKFRFKALRPDGTYVCSSKFVLPSSPAASSELRCVDCDHPKWKCD